MHTRFTRLSGLFATGTALVASIGMLVEKASDVPLATNPSETIVQSDVMCEQSTQDAPEEKTFFVNCGGFF